MNRKLATVALTSFISAAAAISACGGSEDPPPSSPQVTGRGTPACNTWQTAVCSFAARCSTAPAATCQEQATAISCISDQKAQDCAAALDAATCAMGPPGCDLKDLADPVPAQAACQQFIDETCAFGMRCDATLTLDSCRQQAATQVDCTKAIGAKLQFEQCISEIRALSCTAQAGPPSCSGALVLLP